MGVLRLGHRAFGPSELVIMAVVAADSVDRVHAVVAEGADIVEVRAGPGEEVGRVVRFIAAVRDAYPELVVGVSTGRREVAREACAAGARLLRCGDGGLLAVAAESGAGVAGPLALAARAVEAGVEPERVVVSVSGIGELEGLVASGWPVLVSPSDGDLAATAVAAWLGARVFRVHRGNRVLPTRRALRMVSAIRGDIPPAYAVRGLGLGPQSSPSRSAHSSRVSSR